MRRSAVSWLLLVGVVAAMSVALGLLGVPSPLLFGGPGLMNGGRPPTFP